VFCAPTFSRVAGKEKLDCVVIVGVQISWMLIFLEQLIIDREFEFYEFFSFLKFNEFYEFFFG